MDYESVLGAVDKLAGPLIQLSVGDIGEVFNDYVDDEEEMLIGFKTIMDDPDVIELLDGPDIEDTILDNLQDFPGIYEAFHTLLADVVGTIGLFYDLSEDDDVFEDDEEDY